MKVLYIICLVMSWFTIPAQGADTKDMMNTPIDTLVKKGRDYAEILNKPDSALMCFSIVTNRYDANMSREDKTNVIAAFNGKWFVYQFLYFDYTKAYENLKQAQALYNDLGISKARLWLNHGCMYQSVSEPASEQGLAEKAMTYYTKAFDEAVDDKDLSIMWVSMANMTEVAYSLGRLPEIKSRIETLKSMTENSDKKQYADYVLMLYDGLSAYNNKDYANAVDTFKKLITFNKEGKSESRFAWLALDNLAKSYAATGNYAEALKYSHEAEAIACQYDIKDAMIESYSQLAKYYDSLGKQDQGNKYRQSYFQLKDTLLNYRQMASIEELKSIDEMADIEKEINDMKYESKIKDLWLLIGAIILLSMATVAVLLHKKNKKLHQTNISLYEKNIALLQAEEAAKNARKKSGENKYQNSNLSDDDKDSLVERIIDVMENSSEIYSPSFSADRLAELVGDNYKYVSQAINERLNNNFNTLLNEYRVKEACKRINNRAEYGNLTIEAIARSVGFQSINSFRTAFRRLTGLPPSEYQRIALSNGDKA